MIQMNRHTNSVTFLDYCNCCTGCPHRRSVPGVPNAGLCLTAFESPEELNFLLLLPLTCFYLKLAVYSDLTFME